MEDSLSISNSKVDVMKKFFTYIVIVLLGVGVTDLVFSLVTEKKVCQNRLAVFQDSSCDIAILGASRAIHQYNPLVISDSLRYSCNVFGLGSQNIYYHYTMLNGLLAYSKTKPKVVLLELGEVDVNDTPGWNTEELNILFPYYHSDPIVREVLSDVLDKKALSVVAASALYRHNTQILSRLSHGYDGKDESFIGFKPLKREWKERITEKDQGDEGQIDDMKVRYLVKFIQLCRQENMTLIFAVSPYYKLLPKQLWKEKVKEIANNHHIPLLDHEQDKYFLSHPELFYEPFHLNEKGADVYSRIIAGEIADCFAR